MDYFNHILQLLNLKHYDIAIPLMQSVEMTIENFIDTFVKVSYPTEIDFNLIKITHEMDLIESKPENKTNKMQKYRKAFFGKYLHFDFYITYDGYYKSKTTNIELGIKSVNYIWWSCANSIKIKCKNTNTFNFNYCAEIEKNKKILKRDFEEIYNKYKI